MSYFIGIVIIIISYILEITLLQSIALAGVIPNLLLIVVISFAYLRGRRHGMIFGMAAGLLFDLANGSLLGINAFAFMLLGYLAGYFHRIYTKEDYTLIYCMIAAADFLYSLYYYAIEFMLRYRLALREYMRLVCLPELVYTVLTAIPVYLLLSHVNDGIVRMEYKEE